MTEAEWLTTDDYTGVLRFINTRATARQARLCMAGCCRQWESQFSDDRIPRILDAIECCADDPEAERALDDYNSQWTLSRNADLQRTQSGQWKYLARALADAAQKLEECRVDGSWDNDRYRTADAAMAHALFMALRDQPLDAHLYVGGEGDAVSWCARLTDRVGVLLLRNTRGLSLFEIDQTKDRIRMLTADVLRDVFGNPFRPVAFAPEWRTSTVVALAQGMYESRDFGAMPILADALQDAGCDSADILAHCRGPGPHVRGCWVVDLVLGKE